MTYLADGIIALNLAPVLSVGDVVLWNGAWGTQAGQRAVVTGITVGGKRGTDERRSVPWDRALVGCCPETHLECVGRDVVVNLDNGHWAYGSQIAPIKG